MTVSSYWKIASHPPVLWLSGASGLQMPKNCPLSPGYHLWLGSRFTWHLSCFHMTTEFLGNPYPGLVPCPHSSPVLGHHDQSSSPYPGVGLLFGKTGAEGRPGWGIVCPFNRWLIPPDLGALGHWGPVGRGRREMLAQQWGESVTAHLIFLMTGDGI